ncbi:triacylglycerol lipase [Variovorax humicola]|uniref:Triacylglycerol lipase n=1 Tax=Variovorax humicola TaxID=1769758 RepID=A0ABU8WAU8_9BURK
MTTWMIRLRRIVLIWMLGVFAAVPALADAYTQTRYPIVLVHGMLGWGDIAGYDHFYGIPGALREGGAKVYVTQVSGLNTTEARGEQLLTQIRNILAITGAQKVNLIGHSHGGPTARYVAAVAPQLVASVTAVGSPHRGSKLADDVAKTFPPGSPGEAILAGTAKALATIIGMLSGKQNLPEVPLGPVMSLSTAGAAAFNARFPQGMPSDCGDGPELVNGVRYFSWTGTQPVTNLLDPSDVPMALLSTIHGEANDGLVTVCSSRLGRHLGDYRQNHLDEINQFFGLRDLFSVSPVTLYRQQANRLKSLGI